MSPRQDLQPPNPRTRLTTSQRAALAAAVRDYAERGWVLLPLRGKKPIGEGWQETPHQAPELAAERILDAPGVTGVGILMGASSLAVLDVDAPDGTDDPHRWAAEKLLEVCGGEVPATLMVATRRGRHAYFRDPGGLTKVDRGGVELRVGDHQCLAPPSIHPTTGKPHTWLPGRSPADVEVAELPAAVIAWAREAGASRNGHLPPDHEPIPHGVRDNTLTSIAGRLRRAKAGEAAIGVELGEVNAARCRPPLPDAQVQKIARSVAKYPVGETGEEGVVEPVPPFPLDALPAPCARLARELAEAVPCPPDFAAVPVLAVGAAAIGSSRAIEMRPGYREQARLNFAPCGSPGSGKSPGLRAALRPAWAWQERARAEHTTAMLAHRQAATIHEAALARWRTASRQTDAGPPPEAPVAPTLARLVTDDSTVESLAPLLAENQRGLLVARDELAGWVNSIGEYKGGKGSDRQRWLTMWTGAPLTVDRRGAEPIMVARPHVVVIGGIQPDALAVLVGHHGADDGFADRVLVSYPDPAPLVPSEAGVSPAAAEGWAEVFRRLCELEPYADGDPVILTFDAEAQERWRAWRVDLYARRREAPEHLAGALAKLEAHAGRLILVAHELRRAAGEGGGETVVDAESMRRGLALADYFAGHFPRVYARLEDVRQAVGRRRGPRGPTPSRRAELAGRAVEELARAEAPMRLADVARAVGEEPKSQTLREALRELVEAGQVVRDGDLYTPALPRNSTPPHTPHTPLSVRGVEGVESVEFPRGAPDPEPVPDCPHAREPGHCVECHLPQPREGGGS